MINMTAIWKNDGTGWHLLAPTGFADERTLHNLVEETPQIRPLAGDPRLVIVGKEVFLGNGYAELLAVEPSGRLVVIEIKLARNAEAYRAVVAHVFTYAAHLKGLDPTVLERDVLGSYLRRHNHESLPLLVRPVGSGDTFGTVLELLPSPAGQPEGRLRRRERPATERCRAVHQFPGTAGLPRRRREDAVLQ